MRHSLIHIHIHQQARCHRRFLESAAASPLASVETPAPVIASCDGDQFAF